MYFAGCSLLAKRQNELNRFAESKSQRARDVGNGNKKSLACLTRLPNKANSKALKK